MLSHTNHAGMGAAYGTAKSGVGIASMGVMRPELVMKSIVPVVMAGVLGIYGLIIAVIISTGGELLAGGCGRARSCFPEHHVALLAILAVRDVVRLGGTCSCAFALNPCCVPVLRKAWLLHASYMAWGCIPNARLLSPLLGS